MLLVTKTKALKFMMMMVIIILLEVAAAVVRAISERHIPLSESGCVHGS